MKNILAIALLGLTLPAYAQAPSGYWHDSSGKPIAETESIKSRDGFAASLLATTDADWREKWDTPASTVPSFTKAGTVTYGRNVFILTFFSNPQLDAAGNANVRCDLKMQSPTGEATFDQRDVTCYTGKLKGSPSTLYLSAPVITVSADPGDPQGTWVVEVVVRDAVRGTELPLRTSFILK
jgi:hypothetical protein